MFRDITLYVFFIVLLASCNSDNEEACVFQPDVPAKVSLDFEILQDSLMNISSKKDLVKILTSNPAIRDYTFRRSEYPDDSVFVTEIYNRLTNPHLDTLYQEVNRVFGDVSGLKTQFEEAFSNMKYYYPDFTPPKIQTVISGLDTDLLVTDSLIIVSLDFFLGKEAKYRPKMYSYLLRKYDPNDIVPSCMLIYGISNRFNKNQQTDKTVLADMITYGKSFYFAKRMLPCEPDSVFIWYTPEEIAGSKKNEDLIWARFIESQVLFSTSNKVRQDYLGERPVTIQVGEKCPGRIGQWVGWRIVNKYAERHPDTDLQSLMAVDDAQKIFKQSGYKPG
ncbi:gliding motility lipoprotein GldB [Chryseolinea sp. H1M3-3]|uniref:gliding motility lipoprotein GldB n=1 Tax=Chryseolinea sp. H1M3-3 TaxID=3034144 RepID=UPI0023EB38DA|nr:gliding motility lipoprotein GldB [Chryseolinea sp. H1M3-3]